MDETLVQSGLGNLTILILRSPSQYQQYWDLDWAEPDDFQCVLPKLQSRGALSVELDGKPSLWSPFPKLNVEHPIVLDM